MTHLDRLLRNFVATQHGQRAAMLRDRFVENPRSLNRDVRLANRGVWQLLLNFSQFRRLMEDDQLLFSHNSEHEYLLLLYRRYSNAKTSHQLSRSRLHPRTARERSQCFDNRRF